MKKVKIAQIGTSQNSHGNLIWWSLLKQSDIFEVVGYAFPENEREKFPRQASAFNGHKVIEDWEAEHPNYKVGFNGRSGGYLVLYPDSGCKCILPDEVDDCESYEEYKRYCREFFGSVRANHYDLVQTVKLVQDFDKLCDEIRDYVDGLSKMSFTEQAIKESIDRFNEQYADDLDYLSMNSLYVEDGKVYIAAIAELQSLYEAFLRVASKRDLGYRLERDGDYVYYVVD